MTPTVSDFCVIHVSLLADGEDRNLSERHVKERFRVLSEDTKQLSTELGTGFERRHIWQCERHFLGWGAYLSAPLKTPDLADLFAKSMSFRRPKR